MDIIGIYHRRDSRLRDLAHDYSRSALPKFHERNVQFGATQPSGRATGGKFAAIGRSFKGLLSRAADRFASAPIRSARRFNRAHEAYSREADKLLDDLATGRNLDPEKLVKRLATLRKHAGEMARHVAVTRDGKRLTPADAKRLPPDELRKMQGAQARKLRSTLLETRFDVTLSKLGPQFTAFQRNVNEIDWNAVETELGKTLDRGLNDLAKLNDGLFELMDEGLPQEEIHASAAMTSKAIAEDLRTIRDLVDRREMTEKDMRPIKENLYRIFQSLTTLDDDKTPKTVANAMLDIQKHGSSTKGNAQHMVERVLQDAVSKLDRNEASQVLTRLRDEMVDHKWSDIRVASAYPESGREQRADLAKELGVSAYTKEGDEDFRLALKNLLTFHDMLEERAKTSVES